MNNEPSFPVSDPTLLNHPLKQAVIQAAKNQTEVIRNDSSTLVEINVATRQCEIAERAWNKAVHEYRYGFNNRLPFPESL